jgi:hypothetical protein
MGVNPFMARGKLGSGFLHPAKLIFYERISCIKYAGSAISPSGNPRQF